jgi:putative peptidoglycan lipid II flippase
VLGLASGQIIALNLPRAFAKSLDVGSTSTLDYANRLMQVPLDVLASGAAVALFPTLSRLWVENRPEELRQAFSAALQRTIVFMFFACAMLMALAWPLVHLLLEHGKFKAADTAVTANVLRCYALCLPALGTQQLLARGFYATDRSQEPIGVGIMAMAAFFLFGFVATQVPLPGGAGLALAAALATTLLSAGLWITLRRHLGDLQDAKVARAAVIGLVLAVAAGTVAWGTTEVLVSLLRHYDTDLTFGPLKLVVRLIFLAGGTVTGGGLWLVVGKRLGVADLRRKAS